MDQRLVEYFVADIDDRSFTKAAQAATSRSLRGRRRSGAWSSGQLFHRTGRQLVLSPDCEAFVEPARDQSAASANSTRFVPPGCPRIRR
ncbi:hypothetical protein [Saccharopolyspora spinosa]|uniref:hypothetical protein n=1 Tax=Saccharopolyspora spinosa TaxID=60894 RepID=UPI0005C892AD